MFRTALTLSVVFRLVLGQHEQFTFADARIHSSTINKKAEFNPSLFLSAGKQVVIDRTYKPHLYASTTSPFITTEKTSVSASSHYVPYIPISASTSLKNNLVKTKSYEERINDYNDVNVDPRDLKRKHVPDTTHLIEKFINSYLERKNSSLVKTTTTTTTTTTESPSLDFLSFSFDEHEGFDYDDVPSKVKREDLKISKVNLNWCF